MTPQEILLIKRAQRDYPVGTEILLLNKIYISSKTKFYIIRSTSFYLMGSLRNTQEVWIKGGDGYNYLVYTPLEGWCKIISLPDSLERVMNDLEQKVTNYELKLKENENNT